MTKPPEVPAADHRTETVIEWRSPDWQRRIAGVSHELRTPLTILKARLHAIQDGVITNLAGEAGRLLDQIDHILHIVEDFDAMAMADAGRLAFAWEHVDLAGIVATVVADLAPLLTRHGVVIHNGVKQAAVRGDHHRLRQVITNLLTNAAKHSPKNGGVIELGERLEDDKILVWVADDGPGIAEADMPHLFEPFWRSDSSRQRPGNVGSGIGLALTERLVKMHGGDLLVANRPNGGGACFTLEMPRS